MDQLLCLVIDKTKKYYPADCENTHQWSLHFLIFGHNFFRIQFMLIITTVGLAKLYRLY